MNIHDLIYKKANYRIAGIIECYIDYDIETTVDPRKIMQFMKNNSIYKILSTAAERVNMHQTHFGSFGGASLEVEFGTDYLNSRDPQQACQYLLKLTEMFRKVIDDYTHSLEVMGLEHGVSETFVIPKLVSPDVEDRDAAYEHHLEAIAAGKMTLEQAIADIESR